MTSQGVNVLRWGALVLGVFYGFSHQSTINSRDRAAALQHQWDRKAKLIDEAKAEYRKKMISAESKPASGGIISDPDDPKFDLEAYLQDVSARNP